MSKQQTLRFLRDATIGLTLGYCYHLGQVHHFESTQAIKQQTGELLVSVNRVAADIATANTVLNNEIKQKNGQFVPQPFSVSVSSPAANSFIKE